MKNENENIKNNTPVIEDGERIAAEETSAKVLAVESRTFAGATENVSEAELEMEADEQANYKEMSPVRLVLRRFFRSKLSIVGLVMIAFLFLFSFLGPVVYRAWGEMTVDRMNVVSEIVTDYETTDSSGNTVEVTEVLSHVSDKNEYAAPSLQHLLGTDDQGMDVFVRLMYGGRISLMIGFIVVLLETLIGVLLGGISGYFGGWVDQVIMRIVDIFNCIPTLPILLIASAILDAPVIRDIGGIPVETTLVPSNMRIYVLMVIITIFSWSGTARLVRGQILSLREQEYMTATEVMGIPTSRKIFKHLIPNVMPQLIVSMTLGLGSVILYESTLSYLGLGVQLPHAAWGTMIASVNKPEVLSSHWNVWVPAGVMIVIAVLGFNFVGDGLRDAMDPKARK